MNNVGEAKKDRFVIPYYQVDAFAERPFSGNPAGVCCLEEWLPAETMQAIANENCVAATAFLVKEGEDYGLRWFTPLVEEEMCGHGTLGAAWVVLNRLEPHREAVSFRTRVGILSVRRHENDYVLDLPARPPQPCLAPEELKTALGVSPREVLSAASYIAVFDRGTDVASLTPDLQALSKLALPGVVVTAPGEGFGCDIVSRYFAPAKGIPEDPATGSAHAQVVPYWAERLGRTTLRARQLSRRGGSMLCELRGPTLRLTAPALPYFAGRIEICL